MAIGVIWHPAVDQQAYDAAKERVFQAAQDAEMRFHAAGNSPEGWRIIEVWDSREQFEAYGKQLSVMPVLADIPFDSGGPPEIFEVHRLRKR